MVNLIHKLAALIIIGVINYSGYIILSFIYGKEMIELEIIPGFLVILMSLAADFWLLSVLFVFAGVADNSIGCIIYAVAFPVVIVIWKLIAKKNGY